MDTTTVRILFVGQNPENAALIRLLLGSNGGTHFQIHQVRNAQAAAEFMESEHIDVILLNLEAPDNEALTNLAKTIDIEADTPIIGIIGSGLTPPALQVIHAGLGDYFAAARLNRADLVASITRQMRRMVRAAPVSNTARAIRVLIVEDNPGDAALIRRSLRSVKTRDFQISHVRRLSSALECSYRELDVVLLDLNLPDSQDLETLHRLREQEAQIPIIVVTGIEDRRKAVEALANGAQDYLVKGHADGYLLERAILRCVAAPGIIDSLKSR